MPRGQNPPISQNPPPTPSHRTQNGETNRRHQSNPEHGRRKSSRNTKTDAEKPLCRWLRWSGGIFIAIAILVVFYVIITIIIDGSSPFDSFFMNSKRSNFPINKISHKNITNFSSTPNFGVKLDENKSVANEVTVNDNFFSNFGSQKMNITRTQGPKGKLYIAYMPLSKYNESYLSTNHNINKKKENSYGSSYDKSNPILNIAKDVSKVNEHEENKIENNVNLEASDFYDQNYDDRSRYTNGNYEKSLSRRMLNSEIKKLRQNHIPQKILPTRQFYDSNVRKSKETQIYIDTLPTEFYDTDDGVKKHQTRIQSNRRFQNTERKNNYNRRLDQRNTNSQITLSQNNGRTRFINPHMKHVNTQITSSINRKLNQPMRYPIYRRNLKYPRRIDRTSRLDSRKYKYRPSDANFRTNLNERKILRNQQNRDYNTSLFMSKLKKQLPPNFYINNQEHILKPVNGLPYNSENYQSNEDFIDSAPLQKDEKDDHIYSNDYQSDYNDFYETDHAIEKDYTYNDYSDSTVKNTQHQNDGNNPLKLILDIYLTERNEERFRSQVSVAGDWRNRHVSDPKQKMTLRVNIFSENPKNGGSFSNPLTLVIPLRKSISLSDVFRSIVQTTKKRNKFPSFVRHTLRPKINIANHRGSEVHKSGPLISLPEGNLFNQHFIAVLAQGLEKANHILPQGRKIILSQILKKK